MKVILAMTGLVACSVAVPIAGQGQASQGSLSKRQLKDLHPAKREAQPGLVGDLDTLTGHVVSDLGKGDVTGLLKDVAQDAGQVVDKIEKNPTNPSFW